MLPEQTEKFSNKQLKSAINRKFYPSPDSMEFIAFSLAAK